jgi:hypothetical protein
VGKHKEDYKRVRPPKPDSTVTKLIQKSKPVLTNPAIADALLRLVDQVDLDRELELYVLQKNREYLEQIARAPDWESTRQLMHDRDAWWAQYKRWDEEEERWVWI